MEVLKRPVLTEKMTKIGAKGNRFGFIVDNKANKIQIKQAIEKMYGVSVEDVNTMIYQGKFKSRNTTKGVAIGRTNKFKKAIVTLAEGSTIDFYGNV